MTSQIIPPFELSIEDVFQFGDGSTVFVGSLRYGGNVLAPCEAEIFVDQAPLGRVKLAGERMPGPNAPGKRVVFTYDKVDSQALRGGSARIEHTGLERAELR